MEVTDISARLNDAVVVGIAALLLSLATGNNPLVGFMGAFYGWHLLSLGSQYVHAVRADEPEAVMELMDDDDASLPMLVIVVAAIPYIAWVTVGLPLFPSSGGTWALWQYPVAILGGIIWFFISALITVFGVVGSADLLRRATGRKGVQWTPEPELPEEDAREVADVAPETNTEKNQLFER